MDIIIKQNSDIERQGTSSVPYFSYNGKFDTTLCRRILDGAL